MYFAYIVVYKYSFWKVALVSLCSINLVIQSHSDIQAGLLESAASAAAARKEIKYIDVHGLIKGP